MNFNYLLNEKIDYNLLTQYGFKLIDDTYEYVTDLSGGNLSLVIRINEEVSAKVIDKDFNDEYLPFKTNMSGEFSSIIESQVKDIIMDIKDKCVITNNLVDDIKKYVSEKEDVTLEYPWKDTPDACTLKVNGKWFGLIMNVKYKVLGEPSEELVNILNIKLDPLEIEELIDNKIYFKAYHMNKKYWITILLSSKLDKNKLLELIDKSYNIVNKKLK